MLATRALLIALPVCTALGFGAGWAWRGDRAEGAEARQEVQTGKQSLQAEQTARAEEHSKAENMATIGVKHEEDRAAAPAVADAVAADVRAGDLRLRDGWASCETQRLSDSAAAALERDASAQRRAEFAGAVVRAGRDADDQLRACQAVVRADRE